MPYDRAKLLISPVAAVRWKSLVGAFVVVVLIATVSRFVAYAAAISYAAYVGAEGARRRAMAKDAAETAFHVVGALGIIVAFGFLIVTR